MLEEIKDYIQQIAEVISEVLKLDVTIVDKNFIRLAGTGNYKKYLGKKAPKGSGFDMVKQVKTRVSILDPGRHETCKNCKMNNLCKTTANLISPIFVNGKVEGFIAISSFDFKQRQQLILAEQKYFNFISQTSDLIANKISLNVAMNVLETTTSQLTAIINSVHEGILATDENGVIISWNSSAKRILGLNNDNLKEVNIKDLFEDKFELNEVLHKGQIVMQKEVSLKDIYGGDTFLYYARPIISQGEIAGAVMTLKEIAEVHQYFAGYISSTSEFTLENLIGKSSSMKDLKFKSQKVAKGTSTVLIRGESGTGKDLLARGIHSASMRSNGPFIGLNCGAIPEALLESELFGYEEGSFTGAKKGGKPGKFEIVNGGTLFLDEVGDMPLHLQVKLLRVLQDGVYFRVGGRKEVKSDVRIIAATHRDLEKLIVEGKFRQDLYFRLNVVPIIVPPLRERKEDIEVLLYHFLIYYNEVLGKRVIDFEDDVRIKLLNYNWPGNVRELQNLVEYAMNMVDNDFIKMEHIPEFTFDTSQDQECVETNKLQSIDKVLQETFRKAVSLYGKSEEGKLKIAETLEVSRATVYRKIKEYKL
ncbi:MAG: hypothetical protein APF76_10210 [Desulfitibacter sp. BRH_c19]|nr:MAG: hypothetical protein APF76_10210 [Desulfitibacter sp. BRH_c19]